MSKFSRPLKHKNAYHEKRHSLRVSFKGLNCAGDHTWSSIWIPINNISSHAKAFTRKTFFSHSFLLPKHIHEGHAHVVYQHEHTRILSLRFSLHLSFFFACPVCKRRRRDIETEKRNGVLLCLSVCMHTQMHSHAKLLSLLLSTKKCMKCMHAIHTWLQVCLFICACLSVCYLLMA